MRLLRLEADKFSLVEYIRDIPPYAILSHTWGADHEEVTREDLADNASQSKVGFQKLRFCANQAAKDNLEFFWVDTCCIDKSSSSELSEAINSMFQWYRNAVKCYAYLSDVSTTGPSQTGHEIQKSRWFTRGWTLQELIAPASVEFFSVEGHPLGDKHSLQQTLYEITGIAIHALRGRSLSRFSVAERMSWAAKRETKREEDAAYSLLGLFDVYMPLIYGEGREKAFNRLRREINEALEDIGSSALSPISNVPFRRDPDFVDRGTLLDQVRAKLSVPASCVALVGLGGIGKSQISIEVSYRVRKESLTTWVFWVHAGTQARFEEGYRRIAQATKIKGWDDPKADILQLVYSWLCDERNGKWMMIIDNADDATVFSQARSQSHGAESQSHFEEPLLDFLPQSPNGSILVTSRSRDVAYRLTGSYDSIIEVKAMDESDAFALFQKKLRVITSKDEALELLQFLDYMPLAITQAAAFIQQGAPRMTISRYLGKFRRSDSDRTGLLSKDVGDSRRDGRASNSIIATWQISFEHIRKHMPTAARLLSLMSLFDRQGISESLLRGRYGRGEDQDIEADFDEDIQTLITYSLVETSAGGEESEMHRLVQFSTRKWLEMNQELERWKEIYARVMDDNYPAGHYNNWAVCRALLPHAEAAVESQPKDSKALKAWASALFKAAWYLAEMGQYNKAYKMDSLVLAVRETVLGLDHPDTLDSVNSLGLDLGWIGQYLEEEKMHKRAYKARKQILGAEHSDTLDSMGNLALTYTSQGRWKEAEELGVKVTETRKRLLGDEHPSTLRTMANLALTYTNQGRWKEAEELEMQVMEAKKRVLGVDHPSTLRTMANLASTYMSQRRWKEAEDLGFQVTETKKKVLGIEHPSTLRTMANLASTYMSQGRREEAEELNIKVLDARKKVLGDENPDTLDSMGNLAVMYTNQGRRKEAEKLNMQVLETRKKVLGEEHLDTINSMANLAVTLSNQGRWQETEELETQVIETRKKVLGDEHPDTLSGMANLALTYINQGRWQEAEALDIQVMDKRKKVLGDEHLDTLDSIANLAVTYTHQERWKEAEELRVQVVERRKKILGDEHPDTLIGMADLASTYMSQGRRKEAEYLNVKITEVRKRELGAEHRDKS